MNNTEKSFIDKWNNNKDLAINITLKEGSEIQEWILKRNGWNSLQDLKNYLNTKKRILDAGCGNGRIIALFQKFLKENQKIVGIDLTSIPVAQENLKGIRNVELYKANLLADNSTLGRFDFIYCQEVLHHTDNPKSAFLNLVKNNLDSGGEIAVYVYKKKAPVREFVDDYVREKIAQLDYREASEQCKQLTELGKSLYEANIKLKIPKVDILEIEEGEYPLQRFIYHFFVKCFWNSEMNYDQNVSINYDWYHPENCARYTLEEVKEWCREASVQIIHELVDHYGITIRAKLS